MRKPLLVRIETLGEFCPNLAVLYSVQPTTDFYSGLSSSSKALAYTIT